MTAPADSRFAIDPGHSVVVSASAGTGKTYLLVSRLLRLLLGGVDPARILAITFTRKAAGEMSQRLLARLAALSTAGDAVVAQELAVLGLPTDAAALTAARQQHQRLLLHETGPRIQTFHAFCIDLLRRFPLDARVPAGFDVGEYTELLQRDAWDLLCADATRAPDSAVAQALAQLFARLGTLDAARKSLYGFLEHRADWWAFAHRLEQPQARALAAATQALGGTAAVDRRWPAADLDEALRDYAALLIDKGPARDTARGQRILDGLALPADQSLPAVLREFFTARGLGEPYVLRASKAAQQRLGGARSARLEERQRTLAERLAALREADLARRYLQLTEAWLGAGVALLDAYQTVKARQRTLDFADIEWLALRLLRDGDSAEWVQFKLDQRIDHVLIDEFQDTNPTQWQLLLPLLEEMVAGGDRQRSLFIVGDRKQSIYGFRRADPGLQEQARAWLQSVDSAARAQSLERSYRSSPKLIDVVNRVFCAPSSRLDDFQTHATNVNAWGRLELLAPAQRAAAPAHGEGLRDPLREAPPQPGSAAHLAEGERIAAHLQALLRRGLSIDEAGTARAARYGDVMMLVRNRTHIPDYERALLEAGVPFVSADFGTLLETLEVRDLVALLTVLATPFNDLALVQVLRSPLFGVDHAMLEPLAAGEPAMSWFERVLLPVAGRDRHHPLARAAHWLPRWRSLLGKLPTHDLLNRIYHEGEVIDRYRLAFPPPLDQRSTRNLLRLLELALEVDSGRYPSPQRFVAHLRALGATQRDAPSEPPQYFSDRISLMTVHAAKGLEAPLVYLADSAAALPAPEAYAAQVPWRAGQSQPDCLLPGVARRATPAGLQRLRERQQADRQREEYNLLYVAMTRARQMLVVSASETRAQMPQNAWYTSIRDALESLNAVQRDDVLGYGDEPPDRATASGAAESATRDLHADLPAAPARNPARRVRLASAEHPAGRSLAPTGGDDEDGRTRGTAIHRLLEIHTGNDAGRNDVRQALQRQLGLAPDTLQLLSAEVEQVVSAPALRKYFDPACYSQAWNEVPLSYTDEQGDMVSGVIDRLVRYSDHLAVIDYKSHRVKREDAARLAEEFRPQILAYAGGLRRLWPRLEIRAVVVFTALPLALEFAAGDAEQLNLFAPG